MRFILLGFAFHAAYQGLAAISRAISKRNPTFAIPLHPTHKNDIFCAIDLPEIRYKQLNLFV